MKKKRKRQRELLYNTYIQFIDSFIEFHFCDITYFILLIQKLFRKFLYIITQKFVLLSRMYYKIYL